MGIIKTLPELTLERMNQCSDELAKKFLQSVRSIYGSTSRSEPEQIGSGIFIDFRGQKVLVTAAHVIDNNEYKSLYVSGNDKLVLISAQADITEAPNGNRDSDKLDFSIIYLTGEMISEIGGVHYIEENEIQVDDIRLNEKCCLTLGYPNSKNKYNKYKNGGSNNIKATPFVYTSILQKDAQSFAENDANPHQHYLLDYCGKHSKDESNNIVNSISPKGVSGGGLFLIKGMEKAESYIPDTPCSGKLLAVLIEFHKEEKVLMYTRMSVIINALTSASSGRAKGAHR